MRYDEDLDHLLDRNEFGYFLNLFIPYLKEREKNEIFEMANNSKSGKINFAEFKSSLKEIALIGRIKDIFNSISQLNTEEN